MDTEEGCCSYPSEVSVKHAIPKSGRPIHASVQYMAITYSIHKLKIFVVEDAGRASGWQPALEASCEVWNRSRIDGVQFEQVIVVFRNQGIDASKTGKSFHDWADLFVIVSKLIEVLESACAIEDDSSPPKSLGWYIKTRKMTQLRGCKAKSHIL